MARREHFLDIGGGSDIALQRAPMDGAHQFRIGGQHDHRLDGHGVIAVAVTVDIGFADEVGRARRKPRGEEGSHIQRLPGGQIVPQDNHDFGLEHIGSVFQLA